MRATVEDLLNHSKKTKEEKIRIEVVELGKELELTIPSRTDILEIMTSNSTDTDSELVYNSCKIFSDDKLVRDLKCEMNPFEVVPKILKSNTITDIATLLLEKAGFSKNQDTIKVIGEEIKN